MLHLTRACFLHSQLPKTMRRSVFCILGSWPCAALPPLEAQINEKTVLLQDLVGLKATDQLDQLDQRGGFAVLQGLAGGEGQKRQQTHIDIFVT